ncbi:MAG TPA: hypothetical protein VF581_13675 [Flavobacterium sp.]|jgi:protein-arginine kinase activator protein McsA
MEKKRALLNVSLAFAVLFSILFQSLHSLEHLVEQLTTEICEHAHSDSKAEFTHEHHKFDHCAICDFTFSSFVGTTSYQCSAILSRIEVPYFSFYCELPISFSGCSYSLRGPPFIV